MATSTNKSDSRLNKNRRKGMKVKRLGALQVTVAVFACVVGCPLVAISTSNYWTMWQESALKKDLNAVNANFERSHRKRKANSWLPSQLSHVVVDRSESNIATVRILEGDATDEQLRFLERMDTLETLEISSNLATDATLAAISKLPRIRYLSLVGNKFSAVGLLKLRALEHLEQIRLNLQQYSPIELAVLRAEFPGVKLADSSGNFGRAYRDLEPLPEVAA